MCLVKLLLLAVLAGLAATHPHPHSGHTGECMEMKASQRGGRSQFESHPFKCMKDIKLSKEEHHAKKYCRHKAHFYMLSFFKGDKIDSIKNNDLEELKAMKEEFFSNCMVDRLELEADDGSLDTERILKNSLKMESSDVSVLMKMQTIINICVTNNTGSNATEQFVSLRKCLHKTVQEYCNLHQVLLKLYLQRGTDESVCGNVSTAEQDMQVEKQFNICMTEKALKSAMDSKELQGMSQSQKGLFAHTMITSAICVAEKMSWYNEQEGFDGVLYRDFVSNFTGWDDHPETLESILTSMEECDDEWEGDPYRQSYEWESCFAPKIVSICGFNNNVTKFFFPFINVEIQKTALEYIEDMMDAGESMEDDVAYDGDHDDDDYYDDGGESYEDYHDDGYDHDDDSDYYNGDVDDYGDAETVDDGLYETKPVSLATVNEPEKDAVLVDGIANSSEEDSRKVSNESKSNEDDAEDDAEEFLAMARMKHKNGSAPSDKPSNEKGQKPSENPIEKPKSTPGKGHSIPTEEEGVTTDASTNMHDSSETTGVTVDSTHRQEEEEATTTLFEKSTVEADIYP